MAPKSKAKTKPKPQAKSKPVRKAEPKTIDAYLAALPDAQRAALEKLRKTIKATVPAAEECISYKMPAFALNGKAFIWFAGAAKHCAIYGMRETEKGQLDAYDTSGRGTIRFEPDAPLPASLVRKLIKARLAAKA